MQFKFKYIIIKLYGKKLLSMHSWQHCIDRHLKHQIYREKILIKVNPWFQLQHPNERRAAEKGDYTELIIRVKKDYKTYLKFVEVPEVHRPVRMNKLG